MDHNATFHDRLDPKLEVLLARTDWLQALACTLVQDAALADDVVQDTCVALLSRPPGRPVPSVAWFRRVLRNFVYMQHREDVNRQKRERATARHEAAAGPTPAQLLERAELQRLLIDLVLELPEPYRSTILLRFFENRTVAQIASAQEIPVTTVRWRISQALKKLRTKLETRHDGDPLAWILALAPLLATREQGLAAGLASGVTSPSKLAGASASDLTSLATGGAFMTTKVALVLTAGSLALIALGWGARARLSDGDDSSAEAVAHARLEQLEGKYQQAVDRIEALEAAGNERRRLDETLAAFTEELRGMGDAARGASVQPRSTVRELDGRGVWSQLLDLGLDDYGLWDLLHSRGDLDALARLVEEVESWGLHQLSLSELPEEERARIESMLHQNRFRKGYIRFALGDIDGAADAFREQIAAVDDLEDVLAAQGQELEKVTAIYRSRSQHILDAMDTVARKPAPAELEFGDGWVTERRANLADLAGKAVAVFFRHAGDTRSAGLAGSLSRYCAGQPDMETLMVCWHRGDLQAQAETLRKELEELSYQGIAGFDPDGVNQGLVHRFKARVGSASLCILDPRGEVVWLMDDPRSQDFLFVKKLLLRAVGR